MEFDEFVSGLSFRFVEPDSKIPWNYGKFSNFFENKLNLSLESLNTRFPVDDHKIKRELRELIKIPKMSTLALGAIINFGVKHLPRDQAFVNVGVWNGFTFLSGMLNNPKKICIGIDKGKVLL